MMGLESDIGRHRDGEPEGSEEVAMKEAGRSERLYLMASGLLGSQLLFLYAFVSAPEPAPVAGAYLFAMIGCAVAIPALSFTLASIFTDSINRVLIPATMGLFGSAVSTIAVIWHFSTIAGVLGLVISFGLILAEKSFPPDHSHPGMNGPAIRELRQRRASLAARLREPRRRPH